MCPRGRLRGAQLSILDDKIMAGLERSQRPEGAFVLSAD
jgi:hypothetical protein